VHFLPLSTIVLLDLLFLRAYAVVRGQPEPIWLTNTISISDRVFVNHP
jgi:hypothetical protein